MRNPKFYSYLTFFLIFLGILIQSHPILQNKIIKNFDIEETGYIRASAPEYPGMTAIEWESLECPGDDRHIIMYIPDTYDPNIPSAVIWSLHGMWQGIDTPQFFGVYAPLIQGIECYQVAPYGNAIVIVPQGYNAPFVIPLIGNNPSIDVRRL